MTGYGRSEKDFEDYTALVEIRSVNSRYLDINLRIPDVLIPFENNLRKLVGKFFNRGQVSVKIILNGIEDKYSYLQVNKELLHHYQRLLQEIRDELQLDAAPTISDYLELPDLITQEQELPDGEQIRNHVDDILKQALEDVQQMRAREGESLQQDLLSRLNWLKEAVESIESEAAQNVETVKQNLEARIQELVTDGTVEPDRLAQEVAYLADKVDITEETVRLKSHIDQFFDLLQAEGSIGKKLNFLLQEMNREVNTIGAKANNAGISHIVVDCKNEVEKLREQVQNIE